MAGFRGHFEYSIDEKGRLNIPAKFRKTLNPSADETFVIVRGLNKCLQAYPLDVWQEFEKELQSRPSTPQTVKSRRSIFQSASDSQMDAQGRVALTPGQLELAGITDKVILEGQGQFVELWSPDRYKEYFGSDDDFDAVYYQSVQDSMPKR